jgi:hypothetical protein
MAFTSKLTITNTSFSNYTRPYLPWEIIDEILILAGNAKTAAKLQRYTIVKKLILKPISIGQSVMDFWNI